MDLPRDVAGLFEGGDVCCRGDGDGQPLFAGVVFESNVQRAVFGEGLGFVELRESWTRTVLRAKRILKTDSLNK